MHYINLVVVFKNEEVFKQKIKIERPKTMKPGSKVVAAVLLLLGVSSIQEVTAKKMDEDCIHEIVDALTPVARELITVLCTVADKEGVPVTALPDNIFWQKSNLSKATKSERALIRRMCRKCGRDIALTENGIIVNPCKKA